MPPRVSVLMPVHNAQRYLEEALDSVLAQSFGDFELLVVDDGSTDGSLAVLGRYAARDHRVRVTSRARTGYLVALNQMLGEARGELAARMDADDVALPGRFARQVAFLDDHPDVVCVGGAAVLIDSGGRTLDELKRPLDDASIQEAALSGDTPIIHPSAMMRLADVRSVGGYREPTYLAEDLDLWLRLGERGRLANLPEVVVKYRIHDGSVSAVHRRLQLEAIWLSCREAWARRGLEPRPLPTEPWRPGRGRASRFRTSLNYGWWAFHRRDRSTAMHYGVRSVVALPWHPDGWRLLACAALKLRRRG
jgi:glycosyltransferase involved in cell wall biosynthesis